MKKISFLVLMVFASTFAEAQKKINEKKVPDAIKQRLNAVYPGINPVKWEKEDFNYEANFTIDKTDMSVVINDKANIVETEMSIGINDLPSAVGGYISKNYPNAKIKEATKIIDSKGKTTYEAEVKNKDLFFDDNGNFIR